MGPIIVAAEDKRAKRFSRNVNNGGGKEERRVSLISALLQFPKPQQNGRGTAL